MSVNDLLHPVFDQPLGRELPAGEERIWLALGCFWGAERVLWRVPGVTMTAVGYQGGSVPNPSYEQVCTGLTGHAEAVRVDYDPARLSCAEVLQVFFENHDPTQGERQQNDIGPQYRSVIWTSTRAQYDTACALRESYQRDLTAAGFGPITTEIFRPEAVAPFYLAEAYHQFYLHKNPGGYCSHGPNGVSCRLG